MNVIFYLTRSLCCQWWQSSYHTANFPLSCPCHIVYQYTMYHISSNYTPRHYFLSRYIKLKLTFPLHASANVELHTNYNTYTDPFWRQVSQQRGLLLPGEVADVRMSVLVDRRTSQLLNIGQQMSKPQVFHNYLYLDRFLPHSYCNFLFSFHFAEPLFISWPPSLSLPTPNTLNIPLNKLNIYLYLYLYLYVWQGERF